MAVATMDQLVAALATSQKSSYFKVFTPQATAQFVGMWTLPGMPGAAANPSSGIAGDVPVDSTAGAFPFTNPTAPALSYLSRINAACPQVGTLYLYDRLWQNSGISSTLTSAQTVNSVALTRPDANGNNAEVWWHVYAVMGAGTPTVTLSYTNPAGTASRTATSGALVTTMAAGRTGPFQLNAGDNGIKSVQTWTASATFTSGTIGLVIRRRLAAVPVGTNDSGLSLDGFAMGLPPIPDDACLELLWMAGSTTATTVTGDLDIAQG